MEPGAWRIEVSPKQAAGENLFLNVMQMTDRANGARWPVRRLETADQVGCIIDGPTSSWIALFRRDGTRSGQAIRLNVPGPNACHVLVTDLMPGTWHARHESVNAGLVLEASEDSGSVWFEAKAGDWILRR
jgi:heparin/heparan-sulfate lyase